ncbi:hypothetical protein GCM10023116_04260 [Kistimonas scapharcae]|uniref:Uncharacterized protein n=1 Tax=Kistimonas scapharcae TaxID=1036133 RepID=A0ABP8UYI7_9GAMM
MASTNIWQRFKGLIPTGSRYVVTIIALNGNGTSQALLRDGSVVVVDGESASVGSRAFIVDGNVVSKAQELLQYEQEI